MEEQLLETRGFQSLSRNDIWNALDAVLLLGRPQLAVAAFDFNIVQQSVLSQNSLVVGRFETLYKGAGVGSGNSASKESDANDGLSVDEGVESILLAVLSPGCGSLKDETVHCPSWACRVVMPSLLGSG